MHTTGRKSFLAGWLALALALLLVASLQAVKTPPARAQSGEQLQQLLDFYYEYFGGGSSEAALKTDVRGTMQRIRLAHAEPRECWYRQRAWSGNGAAPDNVDGSGNPLPAAGSLVAGYGSPQGGNLLNRTAYACDPSSKHVPYATSGSSAGVPSGCTGVTTSPPVADCPGIPKVNESYIWSLAPGAKNQVWFGTAPNILCTAGTEIFGPGAGSGASGFRYTGQSSICENGRSEPAHDEADYPQLANRMGDWRPPAFYRFNLKTNQIQDMTPADGLVKETFGLRAAHQFNGVVFMGGPNIYRNSVNLFAFRASDGVFLGSHEYGQLSNIRRFTVVGNRLYAAVGVAGPLPTTGNICETGYGNILRWRGTADDPFGADGAMDRVGCTAGEAVEIAAHDGRLYITDWPPVATSGGDQADLRVTPGVWMSPTLGRKGLSTASATGWRQVFRWSEYERSPALALVYGGGPLISYGGKLVVTSIHFPFANVIAHIAAERYLDQCAFADIACAVSALNAEQNAECPGPGTDPAVQQCRAQFQQTYTLASQRPTVMVRLDNLDTTSPSKEVLYGMPAWPIWDSGEHAFVTRRMPLGFPRYGLAGYGNFFNNYTWGLTTQGTRLFATTFDFGQLFGDPTGELDDLRGIRQTSAWGGDVVRFDSPTARGQIEVAGGADNYLNYGFRSILPLSDGVLLGSANPYNLATDVNHPDGVLGGWELVKLKG